MARSKHDRLALAASLGLAVVIVLSGSAAVSYLSMNRWVDHTLQVQQEAEDWTIALIDAWSNGRASIVTAQDSLVAASDAAVDLERSKAADLQALVADRPAEVLNVQVAVRDAEIVVASIRELLALTRAGHRDEAIARIFAGDGRDKMAAFRADAARIRSEEDRLLLERRARAGLNALLALGGGLLLMLFSAASLVVAWTSQKNRAELSERLGSAVRHNLEVLSEVATALAEVRSQSQVADVVVTQGMRAAGADTCTLYMLDEAGETLELLGDRGVAPEVLEKIRRITETSGNPGTFATLHSGTPIWAESESDYAGVFPRLAETKTRERRARAFWSMPLVVEGRPVGLLGMGYYAPRAFSPEDRVFIEIFTKQCAQALLRATHLEREDEANRRFATTLRSIGDAVIATDREGCVTFMNAVAERLTGWPGDEARGRPLGEVFSIFSERTRQVVESPVVRVLREGKIVGLANHTVLRSRQGVEVPIDDSAAPIRDESGRLSGVVLVFRDVTDEKRQHVRREFLARAGEALVSSLDYRTTLGTVAQFAVPELADWCSVDILEAGARVSHQVAVAHVDPNKVKFARELGERYPRDPNSSTGVPQVIRSGKSELYAEIPLPLLEAGAQDSEHRRIIRDLRLESAMIVPLRGHARTLGAMTFVYADSGRRYTDADLAFAEDFARRAVMAIENAMAVKSLEEAQVQERALRREAEIANRGKDEFLATVSHELRTPLNAILGWTMTLRTRNLPPEIDRPLAIIERNAHAQTKLVEDVLDVSRIVSGKLALNLGPTDVSEAVEAAIETVAPAAEAKGITVSRDVGAGPLIITADAQRLQQVIWNLLTNAVKFTPKGGMVSARVFAVGSDICVRVSDTGEGIRAEVLPLVFEPFQQADSSITRRHGGLGLGLAIVKHIVTAHGGTVRAESEGEGKGASFEVRLPARVVAMAVGSPAGLESSRPMPRLDGLRLLVVDDEDDARTLVGTVLGEQGAEIHLAASASEAIAMLGQIRPDVVVSDIGMPEMDGYALIRAIRALSPASGGRTPAVALTAYARTEDAQLAFAAGFQMHVTKPIEPVQLAIVVANLGGRSQDPFS
jgi:PAS domain S-box-containing protein